ncbi:MAG: lytic transglycosylase domain-containing protein [Proteobacteria bacterium]|nr:lytic transglycosylase domain-containing protein [Pseudomonadota bacterium]
MRGHFTQLLFLAAFAWVSCAPPSAETGGVAPLPHVSAPPLDWTPTPAPPPETAPSQVDFVYAALQGRHTGLAEREVRRLAETVVAEAERYQIDPHLILSVMQIESGFYNFAVSGAGAMGLMQIMPHTGEILAAELELDWNGPETLFEPSVNVRMGAYYLRVLNDRYSSWPTALAAYNWGPGRIDWRLRTGRDLPVIYANDVHRVYQRHADAARDS